MYPVFVSVFFSSFKYLLKKNTHNKNCCFLFLVCLINKNEFPFSKESLYNILQYLQCIIYNDWPNIYLVFSIVVLIVLFLCVS